MSVHSAIAAFLDQSPETIAVSALSCLASSLDEPDVAQGLVERYRPLCEEVMSRLVTVANESGKNPNARILALECLYALSHLPNDEFRCGSLLDAVQKLNESFEVFLEAHASADFDRLKEMLTVLLFRCSGYTRIKAGDLLQQIFHGDDTRLVSTLLSIMRNRSLEWEIVHACVRSMYELTTPVSYFTAVDENQPIETTKICVFQDKMTTLLIHLSQQNTLHELFNELGARWAIAVRDEQFGPMMEGQVPLRNDLCDGRIMDFLQVFRYVSVMLLNVADFCERTELVRSHQKSFIAQHQNFIGGTLIPFVRLALRCWEATQSDADESHGNPFIYVAVSVLRLLRFSFYKPTKEVQAALTKSLGELTRQVQAIEPKLRKEYVGMLVLVLMTEVLCNLNAIKIPSLASDFIVLVTTISNDKELLRPGAQFTTAQAFAYCLSSETSTYCASENESIVFLREKLQNEDDAIMSEAAQAIQALEEQLGMLQSLMMELAVGQLLGNLCILTPLSAGPGGEGWGRAECATAPGPLDGSLNVAGEKKHMKTKTRRKAKHPPQYLCMLTKKLMREPVVLRNGHRFELDALQEVVDRVGHVDPLTGEDFSDELQVDMGLQQEIARYRVEMAARDGAVE